MDESATTPLENVEPPQSSWQQQQQLQQQQQPSDTLDHLGTSSKLPLESVDDSVFRGDDRANPMMMTTMMTKTTTIATSAPPLTTAALDERRDDDDDDDHEYEGIDHGDRNDDDEDEDDDERERLHEAVRDKLTYFRGGSQQKQQQQQQQQQGFSRSASSISSSPSRFSVEAHPISLMRIRPASFRADMLGGGGGAGGGGGRGNGGGGGGGDAESGMAVVTPSSEVPPRRVRLLHEEKPPDKGTPSTVLALAHDGVSASSVVFPPDITGKTTSSAPKMVAKKRHFWPTGRGKNAKKGDGGDSDGGGGGGNQVTEKRLTVLEETKINVPPSAVKVKASEAKKLRDHNRRTDRQ